MQLSFDISNPMAERFLNAFPNADEQNRFIEQVLAKHFNQPSAKHESSNVSQQRAQTKQTLSKNSSDSDDTHPVFKRLGLIVLPKGDYEVTDEIVQRIIDEEGI